MTGYLIADEPAPSRLARFAVNPVYPFLALMLGGLWIAWPWFLFNSLAVGSPTRRAEIAWLLGGFAAIVALTGAELVVVVGLGIGPTWAIPYLVLLITVAKLLVGYAVHVLQNRTIEIYEYYGGVLQNGLPVAILAAVAGDRLLQGLPVFWLLVLQ
jgi:hypothetical protein